MRYHNITKADMLNGEGLRVVLWTSGCSHRCHACQNPITWNCNDGLIFDEDAKFTKIVSSDNNYNIVIGETYALQISAGGTISAINTRPGYSDALVLEISNEGETKRNAGLYGSATNDIFTNIVSLGNNKYSLTGTASDGTNTLAYVLDMSDFTVTEEIVSRKSNFLVNGAINLPYGVSYYGEILSNRDLIIDARINNGHTEWRFQL